MSKQENNRKQDMNNRQLTKLLADMQGQIGHISRHLETLETRNANLSKAQHMDTQDNADQALELSDLQEHVDTQADSQTEGLSNLQQDMDTQGDSQSAKLSHLRKNMKNQGNRQSAKLSNLREDMDNQGTLQSAELEDLREDTNAKDDSQSAKLSHMKNNLKNQTSNQKSKMYHLKEDMDIQDSEHSAELAHMRQEMNDQKNSHWADLERLRSQTSSQSAGFIEEFRLDSGRRASLAAGIGIILLAICISGLYASLVNPGPLYMIAGIVSVVGLIFSTLIIWAVSTRNYIPLKLLVAKAA
jgi:hypothetical protein